MRIWIKECIERKTSDISMGKVWGKRVHWALHPLTLMKHKPSSRYWFGKIYNDLWRIIPYSFNWKICEKKITCTLQLHIYESPYVCTNIHIKETERFRNISNLRVYSSITKAAYLFTFWLLQALLRQVSFQTINSCIE